MKKKLLNWKSTLLLSLSPFVLGAGTLCGAMIATHNYQLRRRQIFFSDGINCTDYIATQQQSDSPQKAELQPSSNMPSAASTAKTRLHATENQTDKTDRCNSLRILHISDTHLTQKQVRRQRFLTSLAATHPDLIVLTGDLIGENAAIDPLLQAFAAFHGIPGVYVYGSNDYHAPKPRNPLNYFFKNSSISKTNPPQRLDTDRLTAGMDELGFLNLNNATGSLSIGSWNLEFIGVNDPHIGYAKFPQVNFPAGDAPANIAENNPDIPRNLDYLMPSAASDNFSADDPPLAKQKYTPQDACKQHESVQRLRIGLTHAPYQGVLHEMQAAGCDLVFAGHTHGGQICLPGYRALVTNCDLPKPYASGLFTWPIPENPQAQAAHSQPRKDRNSHRLTQKDRLIRKDGAATRRITPRNITTPETGAAQYKATDKMFVQVSAGIGTSPYSQIRTFCPPEAIQLDLIQLDA